MKVCTKCHISKDITEFNKDSSKKDGLYSSCKECVNLMKRTYYSNNREKCIRQSIESANRNIEKTRARKLRYSRSERGKEYSRLYRLENTDKIKENNKKWVRNNIEKVRGYKRKYRENNPEKIKQYNSYNEYYKKRKKQRLQNDPLFLLKERIGCLIRNSTKNGYKNSKSTDILQISIEEFKTYLENQFEDNMSWNNYGEWHLDHKVPVSLATNKEEFYKLNHYSNFRPLWSRDNIVKSDKLLEEFIELKDELLKV